MYFGMFVNRNPPESSFASDPGDEMGPGAGGGGVGVLIAVPVVSAGRDGPAPRRRPAARAAFLAKADREIASLPKIRRAANQTVCSWE